MVNPFDLRTILLAKHAQHVVLIHFPIALFITGVGFAHLSRGKRALQLAGAAYLNLSAAAVTVPSCCCDVESWLGIRSRREKAQGALALTSDRSLVGRAAGNSVVVGTLAYAQCRTSASSSQPRCDRTDRSGYHRPHCAARWSQFVDDLERKWIPNMKTRTLPDHTPSDSIQDAGEDVTPVAKKAVNRRSFLKNSVVEIGRASCRERV